MKNHFLKQNQKADLGNSEFTEEDFTEIHAMVDELLTSLKVTKKEKRKRKNSSFRQKWEKKNKKSKKFEDLKIRELPFTF